MDLLLVEDKDSFRRLLSQALEGTVWKVKAVADPQEALRAMESQPFHVLVTDLRLPGMSGLEATAAIRRRETEKRLQIPAPRVPIIVGGHGPKRTPALAARFADEFNVGFVDFDSTTTQFGRVRVACDGRTVADHPRVWARHQTISDSEHVSAARGMRRDRWQVPRPAAQSDVEVRCLADYDTELGTDLEGGVA